MESKEQNLNGVTLLGNQNTKYKFDYDPSILEKFEKKFEDSVEDEQIVSLDCFEFASRCIVGDTLIDVARDESIYPEGIPIRDLVGTEGYVFSVDENLNMVAKKYKDVRCTGKQVPIVKVTMKYSINGEEKSTSIKCTPDHLFLVKQGFRGFQWIKAESLTPNMRLIYNRRRAGHDDTRRIDGASRHQVLGEALFGDIKGYHIHHKNHNHFDNRTENLEKVTPGQHSHIHRSEDYGYDESLDIDELIRLYESGENFKSLSIMFNCDVSTIYSRIEDKVEKRTQRESLLIKNRTPEIIARNAEICDLYKQGYLIKEISAYMQLHGTRISGILKENGIEIVESNAARKARNQKDLAPLNHSIVSVEPAGFADVYNMEVEDTHCYFANDVIIHNCPKTGQPDFATIYISYIPNKYMVESKSLKLYLFSFQQHGDFHESCVHMIMQDLVNLLQPKYLSVYGDFNSRGGISILPYSIYADENHQALKKAMQVEMMANIFKHTPRPRM